jgi:starch synthase
MLGNLHSADYEAMMKIAVEYADVVLKRSEPYSEKLNQLLSGIQENDSKRLAEINHESEDWVENYMSIYQDLAG